MVIAGGALFARPLGGASLRDDGDPGLHRVAVHLADERVRPRRFRHPRHGRTGVEVRGDVLGTARTAICFRLIAATVFLQASRPSVARSASNFCPLPATGLASACRRGAAGQDRRADGGRGPTVGGMTRPHVVIVGAGFGGLECARKLARKPVRVTLVDRNNYHLFTPLLYQVASSLLSPGDIARPVRSLISRAANVRFRQAEVSAIDLERRRVLLCGGGELAYDYLVIAAGSTTNFFGIANVEERAFGLKDLPEALELRNQVLRCLETAALAEPAEAAPWLTFVVVGGGPTGVEYAGALSELLRMAVKEEYPELRDRPFRIVLVEGLEEVLPPFPRDLGRAAHRELERKGIEVITGVRVSSVGSEGVRLSNGELLAAETLTWAAGVRPADLGRAIATTKSHSGRLLVDEYLRLPGHDEVCAIGDIASFVQDGREVPMLSAPAMQEARVVARNILRAGRGEAPQPFRYRDRGSMATIGKNAAVAQVGRLHLDGFLGWMAWLLVHLYYLIGFRNRLAVLASWAWNYLRSDRPVRIIARARERAIPRG